MPPACGSRVALAWHDGHLYVAMNSRDSLDTLYPELFTAEDNVNRPLEPLLQVKQGSVFGWPYCFFDGTAEQDDSGARVRRRRQDGGALRAVRGAGRRTFRRTTRRSI